MQHTKWIVLQVRFVRDGGCWSNDSAAKGLNGRSHASCAERLVGDGSVIRREIAVVSVWRHETVLPRRQTVKEGKAPRRSGWRSRPTGGATVEDVAARSGTSTDRGITCEKAHCETIDLTRISSGTRFWYNYNKKKEKLHLIQNQSHLKSCQNNFAILF